MKGLGFRVKGLGFVFAIALVVIATASSVNAQNAQYESRGKRDPFVSLVGPEKASSAKLEDVLSVDELKLEGIASGAKGSRSAIINGELVKKSDKVGEVEIKDISERSVTVLLSGKVYDINLPEQGGPKSGK